MHRGGIVIAALMVMAASARLTASSCAAIATARGFGTSEAISVATFPCLP